MSLHLLPATIGKESNGIDRDPLNLVLQACQRYLRAPLVIDNGNGTLSLVFDPDLSAAEQTILDKIVAAVRYALLLTPDDYEAIRTEVPSLRAYYLNATPTNAESVAALKSAIRVLRAILHD
jgi:hypothetical protein